MKLKIGSKKAFVIFFLLLISTAWTGTGDSRPLKIMSFNIRYDNPRDGTNAWSNRKEMAAKTISFHDVDIVGLQEVLIHQLQDLAGLLPKYAWIGVGRDDGIKKGEYAPVFYLKDRLQLLESGHFWLSETPEKAGSMGWDAACTRIVTWGNFSDPQTNRDFFFFNTHFDHIGVIAREKSAQLLLKRIESIAGNGPVIVTGDFNCLDEEKPYLFLTSGLDGAAGLEDTHAISQNGHYGGTQTFNGFRDDKQAGRIIDFIFVRHTGPVSNHGIIADRWDGRFASDHYPVCAEVELLSDGKKVSADRTPTVR